MKHEKEVKAKPLLTPTRLRIVLSASLLCIALIMAGVFSIAQNILRDQAKAVSEATAKSQDSANLIQSLNATKLQLEKNKDAIARASAIVAESKQYQYQNQIVSDLTQFASSNGIGILSIDFPATTGAAGGGAAASGAATPASPPATTTPSAGAGATAATAPPAVSGVKSVTANITVKNPINYEGMLNFVNAIQSNLTKMQVSSMSLSTGQDGIASNTLTLQVYVR